MVVTIHAHNYDLSPEVKQFAMENLYEPLLRIWDKQGSTLEINLRDLRGTKGGIGQECRCILYMPQDRKIVITEITEDMRTSIHQARKRLLRRARKVLSQRVTQERRPKKYYVAKIVNEGRFRDPTRIPASEEVPGRETRGGP